MDDYGREGHSHKSKHHHHQHGRHSRRHHHHHRKSSSESNQAEYESVTVPQPPPPPPPPPAPPTNPVKERNYKLLVDPCLVKGSKKVYRYEGVVPSEPGLNVTSVKDPRPSLPRRWTLPDILDLPVPKLKIDSNYVGDPPEVEITITNLNDNIDKHFLTDLVTKYGELEEVSIYYHPVSRRHAGFARVVFSEVAAASSCVAALHSRSVMGKQLVVFFDPFGREWSRMIDNIVAPKREVLPPVDSDEESAAAQEKLKDRALITKIDISREDAARSAPQSSSTLPPEDDGGTSPFSHKTPACNPSPIAINVPAFPPPPIPASVPLPNFTQPPPPLGARPPWPIHNEWQNPSMQWRHPVPAWPPRFISPPPSMPPAPVPLPPEKENPLDLDTRIELLLKGGINGMAPPFLAMDINEESAPAASTTVEEPKPQRSRASSISSEEEPYSPPPLPPGVDLSPTYSPKVPLPTIAEYSSDKYLPLSTPPSPFISEEEYLECLLNWRLKHLSYVQQKEKEVAKRKSRQFESDKVSEISSEEDENDFKQTANNDDDRMSLSSLSSAVENIEEVAVPSNPYGSYTFGESTAQPPPPPYQQMMHPKMDPHMQGRWPDYHGQMYPGFQPAHLPYNPLHPPPLVMSSQFHPYAPEQVEPVVETDPINRTVDLALDRVCELLTATLEKDLMKRMTEVLAFNEFEKWWDDEERKYNEGKKEPEKDKELTKEEPEEKKTTADVFLNSLLDSNYDGTTSGLGFRAALPKMPSFKRKQRLPSPGRGERSANFDNDKRNESDEEEMVQLSDSESRGNEPESMMRKKAAYSDDSSDSSAAESSETSSDETDQESSESDIEKEFNNSKEEFLSLFDMEKLERMRIKTPEGRLTPIPSENLDFEDLKSPEESDSRASSPNRSRDLSSSAMEAFKALGLDEFVRDVKIRDDAKPKIVKPKTKAVIQETPSTSSKAVKTTKNQKKVKITVEKEPEPKAEPKAVVSTDLKLEIPTETIQPSVDDHDSEATLSPPEDIITVEHSYSRPKAAAVVEVPKKEPKIESWALDHDYSGPREKVEEKEVVKVKAKEAAKSKETIKDAIKSTTKERKKKSEKLVSHLLDSYLKAPPPPVRSARRYAPRDSLQEMMTCYEFLTKGVDEEDVRYLKKAFESLLSDEKQSYWLNDMHWASHPVTDLQTVTTKNKGHRSGCARTQGFYKLDPIEKQKMKHHYGKNKVPSESMQSTAEAKVWTAASREARSNQRRLLTAFGADTDSDLLKFNQLKFRKKLLKFGKSEIHDWGLFAKEPIAADEMVVEYVGQKVRPVLADFREQKYMKRGIGSSYLFRIDLENIIDATTRGNLARFINHSCNPNCYAKIITIEGSKKIVIYSKRDIKMDEEITYDYKFPLEEEKIPCLCGDALCKGFLN